MRLVHPHNSIAKIVAAGMFLTCVLSTSVQAEDTTPKWKEPYDTPVTITTVRGTGAVAFHFDPGDSISDNLWTRSFQNVLNVTVKTDWVSSDYDIKLNLAMAAGKLPDVFVVNTEQLKRLENAGMLADLTDVYEEWASDRLKSILGAEEAVLETATVDDRLYAIPQLSSGYHPELLWLRSDWMEELKKENPKTVDELEEILLGMKELSGNYSFAVGEDLDSLYHLAIAWDAYPGFWQRQEDGTLVYGSVTDQMKEALCDWQRWYQEGIFRKDFANLNNDAVSKDISDGKAGAMTFRSAWGWVYGLDEVKSQGADACFWPCEIPTVTGKKAVYPRNFKNNGYIVVNRNCKNPEAVIKIIDYYVYILNDAYQDGTMSYDEIVQYTQNNMQHATAPFTVTNSTSDYERYEMIQQALETGDESVLKTGGAAEVYHGIKRWNEQKDLSCVGYAVQFDGTKSGVGIADQIIKEDRVVLSGLWGEQPQELIEYGDTLDDILREGFIRIIMGESDISYFDTLVQEWYEAGGEIVTEAVNRMVTQQGGEFSEQKIFLRFSVQNQIF